MMIFLDSSNATQLMTKYAKFERLYNSTGTIEQQQDILLSVTDSLYCEAMQLVIDDKHTYCIPELNINFEDIGETTSIITMEFSDQSIFIRKQVPNQDLSKQFYNMICNMLVLLEQYYYRLFNAEQLTNHVRETLTRQGITEQIEFTSGKGISNLTNTHITIGIADYILDHLANYLNIDYTQSILDTYSSLPCIVECLRRKTAFNQKLKLYTRSSAKTIIRKSYHQDARKIHSGIGYYTDGDYFSLVEIKACTNLDVEELRKRYGKLLQVTTNSKPTSKDMWVAKDETQLELLKIRCDKKGYSYHVEQRADGKTYNVIYKQ